MLSGILRIMSFMFCADIGSDIMDRSMMVAIFFIVFIGYVKAFCCKDRHLSVVMGNFVKKNFYLCMYF